MHSTLNILLRDKAGKLKGNYLIAIPLAICERDKVCVKLKGKPTAGLRYLLSFVKGTR